MTPIVSFVPPSMCCVLVPTCVSCIMCTTCVSEPSAAATFPQALLCSPKLYAIFVYHTHLYHSCIPHSFVQHLYPTVVYCTHLYHTVSLYTTRMYKYTTPDLQLPCLYHTQCTQPILLSHPQRKKNIATGETSQAITPFHFFDNFKFHH